MNVRIRPYRPTDILPMHEAAAESWREVEPWLPWAHEGYSVAEAERWVAIAAQGFDAREQFEFVVIDEDGRIVGGCGINRIDKENRRANVGYWVRSSAAGRGVTTAAVRELIAWAKANTELERLEILVAVENVASLRVAEKVGAFREGVLRSRFCLHGVFHDAVSFSVIL